MENTTLHTEWAQPLAADVAHARRSVVISSLSLQPRKADRAHPISLLWSAMETAANAGARVTFILPKPSGSHPATAFNLAAAADLSALGIRSVFAAAANLLHAKTCIIDSSIVWVGSGNWTAAAAAHNREAYIRCDSPSLAARLRQAWAEFGFLEA